MVSNNDSPSNFSQAISVFISYSDKDEEFCNHLENHLTLLKRAGVINTWDYRKILAGQEWDHQISNNLNNADIILLLVSADFIASEYCWDKEITRAIERHNLREARVIPIVVREVDNLAAAPFGQLTCLPTNGRAIANWERLDTAFANVVRGIRNTVNEIITGRREEEFRYRLRNILRESETPKNELYGLQQQFGSTTVSTALIEREEISQYSQELQAEVNELDHNIQQLSHRLRQIERIRQGAEQQLLELEPHEPYLERYKQQLERNVEECQADEQQLQLQVRDCEQKKQELKLKISRLSLLSEMQAVEGSTLENDLIEEVSNSEANGSEDTGGLSTVYVSLVAGQKTNSSISGEAVRKIILALILVISIGALLWLLLRNRQPNTTNPSNNRAIEISAGERNLSGRGDCENQKLGKDEWEKFNRFKNNGIKLIEEAQKIQENNILEAKQKYEQAKGSLEEALKVCAGKDGFIGNASETRIYYNNALIGTETAYTLAIAAPISNSSGNGFANIRGVAQLQDEVNKRRQKLGLKLPIKILIVDDSSISNSKEEDRESAAKEFVAQIVARKDVLGIIGHQTSEVMKAVSREYQSKEIPVIAPSVTTNSFYSPSSVNYLFRTTPSVTSFAEKLYDRIVNQKNLTKIAILYDSGNNAEYSISFRDALRAKFEDKIIASLDLVRDSNQIVQEITNKEIQALIITVSLSDGKRLEDLSKVTENLKEKVELFGGNALYKQEFFGKLINSSSVRLELISPWSALREIKPGLLALKPEVREREPKFWGGANWFTVMSYDAASAFVTAISKSDLPLEDIRKARRLLQQGLESNKMLGAFLDFKFSNGERINFISEGKTEKAEAYLSKVVYCKRKAEADIINYCYEPIE